VDVEPDPVPVPQRSARKARGHGHLRRGEILDAAEQLFIAEGYEGATIRKIADAVGVSAAALYMHFPDKACILKEISRRTLELLLARNREIAARPSDPAVRVREMLEAYMRWGLAHPNAYQLVYSAPRPLSAGFLPEATADLSIQCYEIFADVVREIAAEGRLRVGAADSAAQAFWMGCHGVVALLCARPAFEWADADELMTTTLDALTRGLIAD
jgi:AcrR family transcriptional regulator